MGHDAVQPHAEGEEKLRERHDHTWLRVFEEGQEVQPLPYEHDLQGQQQSAL